DGDDRQRLYHPSRASFDERVCERRVEREHEEADRVNSSEARRLYERRLERLRVADRVPELSDDAEPRPLARGPDGRREEKRGAAEARAQSSKRERKERRE